METSTRNVSSDSLLGKKSQNKSPHSASKTVTPIRTTETSTRNESSDSLLGEKSQGKQTSNNYVKQSSITANNSTQTKTPSS